MMISFIRGKKLSQLAWPFLEKYLDDIIDKIMNSVLYKKILEHIRPSVCVLKFNCTWVMQQNRPFMLTEDLFIASYVKHLIAVAIRLLLGLEVITLSQRAKGVWNFSLIKLKYHL